jgi:1-aminocyclopropane-1-carboxylate deaminase
VYVAKMMYGLFDLIQQRWFPPGTTVVAVITGLDFTIKGFSR